MYQLLNPEPIYGQLHRQGNFKARFYSPKVPYLCIVAGTPPTVIDYSKLICRFFRYTPDHIWSMWAEHTLDINTPGLCNHYLYGLNIHPTGDPVDEPEVMEGILQDVWHIEIMFDFLTGHDDYGQIGCPRIEAILLET